jgi:hypothetical protein
MVAALLSKLKSLRIGGEQNAVKLLDACGDQLVKILDSPDAVALLVKKKVRIARHWVHSMQ